MRFFNGMLSTAGFLGVLASGMYVVNFTARAAATRRIQEAGGEHMWAEAVLLGF